jgi:hypothetical protein
MKTRISEHKNNAGKSFLTINCEIVRIPTHKSMQKKGSICLNVTEYNLYILKPLDYAGNSIMLPDDSVYIGDYIYEYETGKIHTLSTNNTECKLVHKGDNGLMYDTIEIEGNIKNLKEIALVIATTDISMLNKPGHMSKIPKEYIDKYIKEYDRGNTQSNVWLYCDKNGIPMIDEFRQVCCQNLKIQYTYDDMIEFTDYALEGFKVKFFNCLKGVAEEQKKQKQNSIKIQISKN